MSRPKVESAEKTISLASRELWLELREKRKFMTFRKSNRQLRRTTRMLCGFAGRKLGGPKPKQNLICLTNLIFFYDKVIHLVEEGKAVNVANQDFSKSFDTVSQSIFLKRQAAHSLEGCSVHWVKNWLDSQAQQVESC